MSTVRPQWTLVETLEAGEFHIVARGGEPRSWDENLSLQRISPETRIAVRPFLERALAAGVPYEEIASVPSRGSAVPKRIRLLAHPVLGPTAVHALQVWINDEAVVPPPLRTAAGVSWMLDRSVIAQTLEAVFMSGVKEEDYVPERTAAMYYSKAIRMDNTEAFVSLCLDPKPGGCWEGSLSVVHADGHVMRWHQHARSHLNPEERGVRVLWHDVTDTIAPDRPTLDVVARQRGMEALGIYPALFRVDPAYLAMWLCDSPAPWVSYWDACSGSDVYHEDDQAQLTEAHRALTVDHVPYVDLVARMRGSGEEEWIPTNMRVSAYPGPLGDHLVVADMYLSTPTQRHQQLPGLTSEPSVS